MNRARWTVQYHQRVLASDPFAYWIEDEKQGAVAYDRVSGRALGAQNGTHVGVTLGQPGIGDGRTSPFYDGANDYTNVLSAALSAAFNGSEGTIAVWARVSGAGVWTDGNIRRAIRLRVDANNDLYIQKDNVNDRLRWTYTAGGVTRTRTRVPENTLNWMHLGLTWDFVADEVRPYFQGVQEGAVINGLGAWGAGAFTVALIGAGGAPALVWDGTLAHGAVWDRALPPAEIAGLAVRE